MKARIQNLKLGTKVRLMNGMTGVVVNRVGLDMYKVYNLEMGMFTYERGNGLENLEEAK